MQRCMPVILLAASLSGCVSGGGDDPRIHYSTFGSEPPSGNRITVCHAYTCKMKTPYTFSRQDIAEIDAVMRKVKRNDTPAEERRAVAYAIAYIDVKVGKKLGIKDRAGMQFSASGDPEQLDCVDVATNTTSYLLVMKANGLITHHISLGDVGRAINAVQSEPKRGDDEQSAEDCHLRKRIHAGVKDLRHCGTLLEPCTINTSRRQMWQSLS